MLKRVANGLASLSLAQILTAIGNLVLVPMYLAHWSTSVYGEWIALSSLTAFLSLFSGGLNIAVINRLSQLYVADDQQEYARVQNSAYAFYLGIFVVGVGILTLFVVLVPLSKWLGIRSIPFKDAEHIVWFIGVKTLWAIPAGLVLNTYRIAGNLAASQWIMNIQNVLILVGTVITLVLGGGPVNIALIWLLIGVVVTFIELVDVRRRMSALQPGFTKANWLSIRQVLVPSWHFLLMALSGLLTQQGPVILISSRLGGETVAVFVTIRTLINLVRQTVGTVNYAVWPEVTRLEARNEFRKLQLLHRLLVFGATTIAVMIAAMLFWEGDSIVTVWTQGAISANLSLIRLLLLQLVLATPWLASALMTAATNQNKKLAYSYLASSVIGVGAISVLIKQYGILSVPIGLMLGEAAACYHFVIKESCGVIQESYGNFVLRLYLALLFTSAAALGAGAVAHYVIQEPYILRWLIVGTATCIASGAMMWIVWLDRESRRVFLRWLSQSKVLLRQSRTTGLD